MKSLLRTLFGLSVAALLALPAASKAQPVVSSDLVEAKAIVESVDLKSRTVLLRGDDGELATIVASPEVHNLPQVHPGDVVLVSVHRSVALQMSKAGSVTGQFPGGHRYASRAGDETWRFPPRDFAGAGARFRASTCPTV